MIFRVSFILFGVFLFWSCNSEEFTISNEINISKNGVTISHNGKGSAIILKHFYLSITEECHLNEDSVTVCRLYALSNPSGVPEFYFQFDENMNLNPENSNFYYFEFDRSDPTKVKINRLYPPDEPVIGSVSNIQGQFGAQVDLIECEPIREIDDSCERFFRTYYARTRESTVDFKHVTLAKLSFDFQYLSQGEPVNGKFYFDSSKE